MQNIALPFSFTVYVRVPDGSYESSGALLVERVRADDLFFLTLPFCFWERHICH